MCPVALDRRAERRLVASQYTANDFAVPLDAHRSHRTESQTFVRAVELF